MWVIVVWWDVWPDDGPREIVGPFLSEDLARAYLLRCRALGSGWEHAEVVELRAAA